jgi:hypothetical protein
MCQFFSAVVTRSNGELYWSPWTDSHEEIIAIHRLKDGATAPICRVELTPKDSDFEKIDEYIFKLDETAAPAWFDDEMRNKTIERMKQILRGMVIKDNRAILTGGAFIVCGTAKVGRVITGAVIKSVGGSATIDYVRDSAKIDSVYDSAKIDNVYGSAKIDNVYGSAKIDSVYGLAKIDNVYGSAKIGYDLRTKK